MFNCFLVKSCLCRLLKREVGFIRLSSNLTTASLRHLAHFYWVNVLCSRSKVKWFVISSTRPSQLWFFAFCFHYFISLCCRATSLFRSCVSFIVDRYKLKGGIKAPSMNISAAVCGMKKYLQLHNVIHFTWVCSYQFNLWVQPWYNYHGITITP